MAEKPTIPDFPTLPDFGQMITQACEVVASVRGIPYDFNGTLSLENKFVVLFKTVKEMFDAQDELVKSYKALYDFVNQFFTNIDLQDEVNKKIEEMKDSGELLNLLSPTVNSEITAWLTANITNPSNPPIDKSLTVENAAADAKATGDKINSLNEDLDKLNEGGLNLKDEVIAEDINNWLDEHPEATTTVNYAITTKVFDNIDKMKADSSLKVGDKCKTLGYYSVNDGGGALYKITDVEPNGFYELFGDKFAELIIENNTVNIRQIGAIAKSDNFSIDYDIRNIVLSYISKLDSIGKMIKLYIPSGIWETSPLCINRKNGFYIFGDISFSHGGVASSGTIITPITNKQEYVVKIGGDLAYEQTQTTYTEDFTFKNIGICGSKYTNKTTHKTLKIINSALIIDSASLGNFGRLFVFGVYGTAIKVRQSWELSFPYLEVRNCGDFTKSKLIFDKTSGTPASVTPNITNIQFDHIGIENCNGTLIESKYGSILDHCYIGNLNVECNVYQTIPTESYPVQKATLELNEDTSGYIHTYIADIYMASNFTINNIQLSVFGNYKAIVNDVIYVNDTVFNFGSGSDVNMVVNSITIDSKKISPIVASSNDDVNVLSSITLNLLKVMYGDGVTENPRFLLNHYPLFDISNVSVVNRTSHSPQNLSGLESAIEASGFSLLRKNTTRIALGAGWTIGGILTYDSKSDTPLKIGVSRPNTSYPSKVLIGKYLGGAIKIHGRILSGTSNSIILERVNKNGESTVFYGNSTLTSMNYEWVTANVPEGTQIGDDIYLHITKDNIYDLVALNVN